MDKLEHPEISTGGLTAEVRKAMARQALRSHELPIHLSATQETSAPSNPARAENDNSTRPRELSTDTNFGLLEPRLSALPKSPRLQPQPSFEPNENDEYHLHELLKFHDADFLRAAYRAVLKREPDSFGNNFYLEQLRAGHLDKVDLLGILRFSSEGKLKNVKINGLALPTFVRRLSSLPVIGYPIRLGTGLLRLPSLIHRVRRQEAYSSAQSRRLAEHVDEIAQHVDTVNDALTRHLSNLSASATDLLSRSELHHDRHRQLQQQLQSLIDQQQKTVTKLRLELRAEIANAREQNQQLIHGLIQEQRSLLESATNESRNQLAQLKSSIQTSIAQLDESTQARIAEVDASAQARTAQLESSARARTAQLESSAQARTAQLDSSAQARTAQLESSARAWIAQLESSFKAEIASLGDSANNIRTRVTETESVTNDLQAWIRKVESSSDDLRSTTDQLETSTSTVQAEIEKVYQQLQHARTELAVQASRMALILDDARRNLRSPFDQQQLEIIAKEEQHKLDALYAELEDNFRGSYGEIKDRFRTYLPHIQALAIGNELPVVDLGCGRGEWLELLKEEGHRALGVDTNRVLLDRCRARGLAVVELDVLQYLRELPDNSLKAITAFHLVEHLEIEVLMQLLNEIVRVVHPGGVIIFETPNPENVLVGSNYFYFDPTHRNPLPSLLMKFLLESRGLQRVEVMNLHAWDQGRLGGKTALTARFNDLFYGPMDYAIAGWKVSA